MCSWLFRASMVGLIACGAASFSSQASAAILYPDPAAMALGAPDLTSELRAETASSSFGLASSSSQPSDLWYLEPESPLYHVLYDEFALPIARTGAADQSTVPGAGSSSSPTGPTQSHTGLSTSTSQIPSVQITLQRLAEVRTSLPPPPTSDLFRPPRG